MVGAAYLDCRVVAYPTAYCDGGIDLGGSILAANHTQADLGKPTVRMNTGTGMFLNAQGSLEVDVEAHGDEVTATYVIPPKSARQLIRPGSFSTSSPLHLYGSDVVSGNYLPSGAPLPQSALPEPGDYITTTDVLYGGSLKHHTGNIEGSGDLNCTVVAFPEGYCDGLLALGNSILVANHTPLNMSSPMVGLSAGTGDFLGAHGKIIDVDAGGHGDDLTIPYQTTP